MDIEALRYKTEDKTEIIVCVRLYNADSNDKLWRICDVKYRPYKKKAFISRASELGEESRYIENPTLERKQEYIRDKLIEFIGVDVVKKAYMAAWESIKPDFDN